MRELGSLRGARTIGLALAAGLVGFEVALALAIGAVGIPGLALLPLAEKDASRLAESGGETIVAKPSTSPAQTGRTARPTRLAMADRPSEPPNLRGLADIPPELLNHDTARDDGAASKDGQKAKVFEEAGAQGEEKLPWDMVEPVPYHPVGEVKPVQSARASPPPDPNPAPQARPAKPKGPLPAPAEVASWLKAKATELKSNERERPLYHLELWLDPPAATKRRIVAVVYAFESPAVMPQSQVSSDQASGFRTGFGSVACADKIMLTLKFDDGRTQQAVVDGCKMTTIPG
jgi:hypothetical protein